MGVSFPKIRDPNTILKNGRIRIIRTPNKGAPYFRKLPIWVEGFRVSGLGFRVEGLGSRVTVKGVSENPYVEPLSRGPLSGGSSTRIPIFLRSPFDILTLDPKPYTVQP